MNQKEFAACSAFEKWAEILMAREPYLPEAAEAAYVETTNEEGNNLYEATGLILARRTIQLYRLRIAAKGHDWDQEISRWSIPLSAMRIETRGVANDCGSSNELEELEYAGVLRFLVPLGEPFGEEITLPLKLRPPLQRRARQRLRNFFDSIALSLE
jgi:hypothetical protein